MILFGSPIYFCGFFGVNRPEYAINSIYSTYKEITMGFTVLPTNIGGVNLNSITGPLASLLAPTQTVENLVFPSDLGSNPAMGHAVIITAHDYTSELGTALEGLVGTAVGAFNTIKENPSFANLGEAGSSLVGGLTSTLGSATQAPRYAPVTQTRPLATVSLFMPETVNINYNSSYSDVSITEELGVVGMLGNAYSDLTKKGLKDGAATPYGVAALGAGLNALSKKLGGTGQLGSLAAQGAGVFINPQMQLLYKGISLRTFQLEFLLTPKSSAEAKVAKNICDTLAFYSLPGLAGSQDGLSGQFLTPPQIFKVQFKFLGTSSITGTISNVITNALTNSGLGFVTQVNNPTGVINSGVASKTYTVGDCVLTDVNIDYAPNGWAAYNDGYPVQTRLTLQFKETTMITKDAIKNQAVQNNYNDSSEKARLERVYGSKDSAYNDAGY